MDVANGSELFRSRSNTSLEEVCTSQDVFRSARIAPERDR
jgi:hypothetical protein